MSAKTEREQYNGRTMFSAFRDHCNTRKLSLTEDNLKVWDEKCNQSRIKRSFGTPSEVYAKGLRILYRQYLDRYSTLLLKRVRKGPGIPIAGIKPDGMGNRRWIGDLTKAGLQYNKKKTEREICNAVARAKFYGMSLQEVRSIVENAFETAVNEAA